MTKTVLIDPSEGIDGRLKFKKITLEDVAIYEQPDTKPAVIGRARIVNLGYEKTVFARITFDEWTTYRDYKASYLQSSEEAGACFDIFGFGYIITENSAKDIEFALCCTQNGVQYWDNNNGNNYHFHLSEQLTATKDEELLSATWRANEHNEIMMEESDYPRFQPHPLTPTRLRFYSTIRNAPEKEILPKKAKNVKHMYVYNSLALDDLWNTPQEERSEIEVNAETEEYTPEGEEEAIVSSHVGSVESSPNDVGPETSPTEVQEDSIQPELIEKQVDQNSEQDIFDKLEKENSKTEQVEDSEQGQEITEGVQVAVETATEKCEMQQDDDDLQANVDRKEGDSKDKETAKGTPQDADSTSNQANANAQTKEIIENEEHPRKRKKKGLFGKLCCGKAEYD